MDPIFTYVKNGFSVHNKKPRKMKMGKFRKDKSLNGTSIEGEENKRDFHPSYFSCLNRRVSNPIDPQLSEANLPKHCKLGSTDALNISRRSSPRVFDFSKEEKLSGGYVLCVNL